MVHGLHPIPKIGTFHLSLRSSYLGEATIGSSKKTAAKTTKKMTRVEQSTQESEGNECPPLIRHRPSKELVTVVTPTPLVLALPKFPSLPKESAPLPCSPIHSFYPSLLRNTLETILSIQLTVPPLQAPNM